MNEPFELAQATPDPAPAPGTPGYDCWNRIGIGGDRSCPELKLHVHCRNCPVFASAAMTFFDRSAPSGYLEGWTSWLARTDEQAVPVATAADADPDTPGIQKEAGVLIFRLDREWLAFRTRTVVEVALPRPVHRIPHRRNANLSGLVNLRGQLQLCISLHALLGVHDSTAGSPAPPSDDPADGSPRATTSQRMIVLRDRARSEVWAFAADEVHGVEHVARGDMQSVPSTLANPAVSFSQAILPWNGRSVGFLDEQRVFAALRSIGQ